MERKRAPNRGVGNLLRGARAPRFVLLSFLLHPVMSTVCMPSNFAAVYISLSPCDRCVSVGASCDGFVGSSVDVPAGRGAGMSTGRRETPPFQPWQRTWSQTRYAMLSRFGQDRYRSHLIAASRMVRGGSHAVGLTDLCPQNLVTQPSRSPHRILRHEKCFAVKPAVSYVRWRVYFCHLLVVAVLCISTASCTTPTYHAFMPHGI